MMRPPFGAGCAAKSRKASRVQRKAELTLVSRVELKSSRETEEMRRAGGQVPAFWERRVRLG